ncbi:MAG: hypothetical protein A4S12_01445 [Proteobacteria bacterium SG_bin5]|nr:MAG: hypothetical protein A4S12_01445 [Proteobacteria bacterium SG_bin5]
MWWIVASAALGCPGLVDRVELERGRSDPPATLVPDHIGKRGDQLWRGLRATKRDDAITLTCITGDKAVKVRLPRRVERCEWRARRVRCS